MKQFLIFLLFVSVFIGAGCGPATPSVDETASSQPTEPAAPTPTDSLFNAEILAEGERVYVANCASCHGIDLKGGAVENMNVPSHLDDGHTWHHSDVWLLNVVRNGGNIPGQMPAYKDVLTENEMIAVLDYIKSHWSPRIYEMQQMRNR